MEKQRPVVERAEDTYKELGQRAMGGGGVVTLYWKIGTVETRVEVDDVKHGQYFVVDTPEGKSPNDVFLHPYAYQAQLEND